MTVRGMASGVIDSSAPEPQPAPGRICAMRGTMEHVTADDDIRSVLEDTRTWAVVGCSPDPRRDSHRIAALLQRHGYRVVPVNPFVDGEILGERCHASVESIPAD